MKLVGSSILIWLFIVYINAQICPADTNTGDILRLDNSYSFSIMDNISDEEILNDNKLHTKSTKVQRDVTRDSRIIKLLTYNFFIRPPLIKNNESDYKDERTQLFIPLLNDFDVIALQEAFSFMNSRVDKIINEAKNFGFNHHVRGPPSGYFSIDGIECSSKITPKGGLLILSKHEIVRQATLVYSEAMASDQLSQKGSIYALIKTPEGALFHLFNTHLQASYFDPSSVQKTKMFEAIKKSQLEELFRFILKETSNDNWPIFLVGDLNINALNKTPDSEYSMLKNLLDENFITRDLILESLGDHPITICDIEEKDGQKIPKETVLTHKIAQGKPQCLDYILLLRKKNYAQSDVVSVEEKSCKVETFSVKNQKFTQLSDHYGVSVSLRAHKPLQ